MGRPTILICDDEEGVRESFGLILQKDYALKFAENALEAVDLINAKQPDLLLLDVKMPKVDGIRALKEIREAAPNLKVVMLTGYRSIEIAKEAAKHGAVDYVTKPFEPQEVLLAVKKALAR